VRPQRDKRELAPRNREMLALHREGLTLCEIGAIYRVSTVRVHLIVKRETARQELESHNNFGLLT
jgi:hypothetical protein